jgi:hypothetical protein
VVSSGGGTSSSGGSTDFCTFDYYSTCSSDSDCPGSFQCVGGVSSQGHKVCTVSCSQNSDCAAVFATCPSGSYPGIQACQSGYCAFS